MFINSYAPDKVYKEYLISITQLHFPEWFFHLTRVVIGRVRTNWIYPNELLPAAAADA